jgi:hypothetical protein
MDVEHVHAWVVQCVGTGAVHVRCTRAFTCCRTCKVIPFEGQTTIPTAGPIKTDFIGGLEGGDEMIGVGARRVADAEVVDNEAEDVVPCGVPCCHNPGVKAQGL